MNHQVYRATSQQRAMAARLRHGIVGVACATMLTIVVTTTGGCGLDRLRQASVAPGDSRAPYLQPGAALVKTGKRARIPRTADGRPDLGGLWDFATATPLERPPEFAGKPVLTEQEARAYVKGLPNDGCRIIKCDGGEQGRLDSAYGAEWWAWGATLSWNRTSLIVDPPDGRIPPLTTEAMRQAGELGVTRRTLDGPEDFSVADRCLVGFNSGPPMTPSVYNNFMQVFQTGDHVVILNEMIHNARIVPLDGRPHLPSTVRQWVGDSRGRWDGDTLIVETTNFRADSNRRGGIGDESHLVERFTRVNAETLLYEYTMNDAKRWTKPWTVQIPMIRAPDGTQMYEYACHEGNYAMRNSLSAARSAEQGDRGR